VEHQLWNEILALLERIDKPRRRGVEVFTAGEIVMTWMWAVLHDRPVSWACEARNWPLYLRRRRLPSSSTMSRRLRSPAVRRLLKQLEQHAVATRQHMSLLWFVDSKPLVISGCSKDRQAGYGRAAGCKAKGYKIHAIVGNDGAIAEWRVAPMNKDERVMGERMLRTALVQGYVLADSNYDSNKLHTVCFNRGNTQLMAPPRYGYHRGRGHRRQSLARLRAIELLENPQSNFGQRLHCERTAIERYYGRLTNWGGGLNGLPAWVRTHRRVHRWVQGKLILTALRRHLKQTTYVK
jgi:hypothetical protein